MRFRPHAFGGRFDKSGIIEVDGIDGLIGHLRKIHPAYGPPFNPDELELELYIDYEDERIGWSKTYLVKQKYWGVVGYTDSDE